MPGLDVLPFTVRGGDPAAKLLPVVPVGPRDLGAWTLRFAIDAAPLLACGELNAALRVAGTLDPLVLIVGSILMV